MDTKGHEGQGLLHGDLVYSIVGCAIEVLRGIGHGLHEHPYEHALVVEFRLRGLRYDQQRRFPVMYKGEKVSEFVPDLVVDDAVIVDTKVVSSFNDSHVAQMTGYLAITGLRLALLLNFKTTKLEWKRVVR